MSSDNERREVYKEHEVTKLESISSPTGGLAASNSKFLYMRHFLDKIGEEGKGFVGEIFSTELSVREKVDSPAMFVAVLALRLRRKTAGPGGPGRPGDPGRPGVPGRKARHSHRRFVEASVRLEKMSEQLGGSAEVEWSHRFTGKGHESVGGGEPRRVWLLEGETSRHESTVRLRDLSKRSCDLNEFGALAVSFHIDVLLPREGGGVGASLARRMERLALEGTDFDATLVCEGRRLPVHKAVLAETSKVFAAMFSHEEWAENQTGDVNVVDVSLDVLEAMLEYAYAGRCDAIYQLAPELLAVSERYDVPALKAKCEVAISRSLTLDDGLEVLRLGRLHRADDLVGATLQFLKANLREMLRHPKWRGLKECDPDFAFEVLELMLAHRDGGSAVAASSN